jgi:hypothetical protein
VIWRSQSRGWFGSRIIDLDSCCLFAHDLIFFEGGGVATTLCLPARVFKDPALGPSDEALAESALGFWAEMGIPGINVSPPNLGMEQ